MDPLSLRCGPSGACRGSSQPLEINRPPKVKWSPECCILYIRTYFSLWRPPLFRKIFYFENCPIARNRQLRPNGLSLRLLVKEYIAIIGIPIDVFEFLQFQWFCRFRFFLGFGSLKNSLLCIVGELTWGGFAAVAVGISGRCPVTGDTWHVTRDTWHVIFLK